MQTLRIVFMGTPDFAVPCLQTLLESPHSVVGVFTQPDKPQGRKMVLTPPPVKVLAAENGVPVFQPEKMKDPATLEQLKVLDPDLIVVVAYGRILPRAVLELPRYGCINVHASLLPKPLCKWTQDWTPAICCWSRKHPLTRRKRRKCCLNGCRL